MTKLHNLTLFSDDQLKSFRWKEFVQSDLGKLYQSIPFKELASLLPRKKNKSGAPPWFQYEGYFGLMFLKSYLGLSDKKLIARINTDWALQMFCSIQLNSNQIIRDDDLPSRIRMFLGNHLDIESFQDVLLTNWKPYLEDTHCFFNDATAYESYIKYPTDIKLLWDCCVWVFETLHSLCKYLNVRRPRSKYKQQQLKQADFQKKKRKTYKMNRVRKRALLYLLNKGLGLLKQMLPEHEESLMALRRDNFFYKLAVIEKVYRQQEYMFDNQTNIVQDRIVSLFKPYLRPIVRGKENKRVEFGMKLMISQVDGINLIDKLSFNPYNEAKYFKDSIIKHKQRFGSCHQVGIDQIYGTNENRKYMKEKNIYHCLVRKGKPSKYEDQVYELRKHVGRQRATVLEGSFGNEKNHYNVKKVKARLEETEIIWVVFGIMTANAVRVSKRVDSQQIMQRAA